MTRMWRGRQQGQGFTLVELLIALAITAPVVALVLAGFGLIGRTDERNHQVLGRAEQMLVVSQWLGRKLDTLRIVGRMEGGAPVIFFTGNAAGAMWVAPLPERGEDGGLHVFRANPLRHADGRVDLAIEALPYDGAGMALNWNAALRETLLPNVRTLQWHYQDGRSGQWSQEWGGGKGYYPSRIKVEIGDDRGDWPPLVFALARAR